MADRPPFARVAIVGVTGSGKTTLFSAMTGMDYSQAIAGGGKVLTAPVRVANEKLLRIHRMEHPGAKLTCPSIEVCDTPPLYLEGPDRERNPSVLHKIREMAGLVVLLKAYEDGPSPAEQLESIRAELLLNDAEALTRRLEKIEERLKRSIPNKEKDELNEEKNIVTQSVEALSEGNTTTLKEMSPSIEKRLRSFALFARKPILAVNNISEKDVGKEDGISIRLEQELMGMEEEERAEYMKDYGMETLILPNLPVMIQTELKFRTFLTVGPTEVAGWVVPDGSLAPEAAGAIHTDFQKGFINAEVIGYSDWEEMGTVRQAELKHKQRLEGKQYVVQDWDIVNIKFAL